MGGFPTSAPIEGGFANPPMAAQSVFRALMDAMARPGTVHPVAPLVQPPAPLTPSAAAVALTLCDHDTPLWLDPRLETSGDVRGWLGFHCGAPLTTIAADAHFVLASSPGELMALENFAQGSQEYPDRSTTLILQVETLTKGRVLHLEGPGIATGAALAPFPMPRHFGAQWLQNRARFPRGVDLILAAPDAIACLPRTTRIFETEA
ncbi:phosphonate C-P lyase system protein PhnH [Aquibium microcysteis]|uniref:phosphonate C-P lyase system protein PhnH n=1 Tax=Aquibium microcysteis TaxID=675281 RepID=UPI00165CF2EF|nr:phosphonate C-P lyase system protein PhnH [Aquibium microcysteis]